MNGRTDEVEVELSHGAAELLCKFLESLEPNNSLYRLLEDILDAKALAVWRRENVIFDLRLEEVSYLVAALMDEIEAK